MENKKYQVIIIGSGPAGYTAAIYTIRAELKTLILTGPETGGQLSTTTEVENFPGFPGGVTGPDLMAKMNEQATGLGVEIVNDRVVKIEKKEDKGFIVITSNGKYQTEAVIIASGASARWLGLPSEQKFRGKGVSACATCDGFFFRGKTVAVVGGGDVAMEESTFLANFADKVYQLVLEPKAELVASKAMQNKAFANNKIEFRFEVSIKEILGDDRVTSVVVKDVNLDEEEIIELDGIFVAIGHKPNTDFLKEFIDLDKHGYVIVKDNTQTNVEGIFAAGDVVDYKYRQAVTAAGLGCMAALDTIKYLNK